MPTQLHDYAEEELLYNRFMEPALRQALSFLPFPKTNGKLLDAGCGPGGLFPLLLARLSQLTHRFSEFSWFDGCKVLIFLHAHPEKGW